MKSRFFVGGAQKGTRVRWAKDRRSGVGAVVQVLNGDHYPVHEREFIVLDDETGETVQVTAVQMKFEKTPNRVKKQRYAEMNNL